MFVVLSLLMDIPSPNQVFSYAPWESKSEEIAAAYAVGWPYPFTVLDNFLPPKTAMLAAQAFPPVTDESWIHYLHYNERKHGLNKWDAIPEPLKEVIQELNSPRFLALLEKITGIRGLLADDLLEGGGLHQSSRNGFLNVHADFTVHPLRPTWRRRVNLLIYLNPEWNPDWGGNLELWTRDMNRCEKEIQPLFNRAVIFNTDDDSFHGVPNPIQCPEDQSRSSLALYYFTESKELPVMRPTNYQARPEDGWRSALIWADKQLVAGYTHLKRRLGLNDNFVSRLLGKFDRKRHP